MDTESQMLMVCLSRALGETDLVQDISGHCALAGISFKSLTKGAHTASEVASKLFLTEEESVRLLQECLQHFEAGGPQCQAGEVVLLMEPAEEHTTEDSWPDAIAPPEEAGDTFCTPPASPRERVRNMNVYDIPVLSGETAVKLVIGLGMPAKKAGFEPEKHQRQKPQPSTKAISASPNQLRTSCPAFVPKANCDVPSYLRSTATFQARSKNAPEPIMEDLHKEAPKSKKKNKNVFARIFAPTATFLARMAGKGPASLRQSQPLGKSDVLRQSVMDKILKSPQGQRITEAKPFSPHLTSRCVEPVKPTSEESALKEAQKNMFKRHEVPKHVHEYRPIEGMRVISIPKTPDSIFEPFKLESQVRHSTELAKRTEELAAAKKAALDIRKFKAMEFDKTIVTKTSSPMKPEAKAVTVPIAPHLRVGDRSAHYCKDIDPARKARMTQLECQMMDKREKEAQAEEDQLAELQRVQLEEQKREIAFEKMTVQELRRSMVFKARDMPCFDQPFKPDGSKAALVTQSLDFKFRTELRLGKAAAERNDLATAQVQRIGGAGYGADPFMASLRGSAKSPGTKNLRSSMASLRSPMASPLTGLSPSPSSRLRKATGDQNITASSRAWA